jgi:His-Xaa-Ser repeat protein HxsA
MSKFTKSLSLFMAAAGLVSTKNQASQQAPEPFFSDASEPFSLRPLNQASDNLYAAHRSHSSHSSHRSSSSSYSTPSRKNSAPSGSTFNSSPRTNSPVDAGRPAVVTPSENDLDPADKKLMELVMRVQMGLIIKGYAPVVVDGIMGEQTRAVLKQFQQDNGLNPDGLMGTETLNALGVVVPR